MARAKGFTLVELLVVIAIIALLFAMFLPAAGRLEFVRKTTQCQKNLQDIHRLLVGYCGKYDGRFPWPVIYGTGGSFYGSWTPANPWAGLSHVRDLKQAGARAEMFYCPLSPSYGDESNAAWKTWKHPRHYVSQKYGDNGRVDIGYVMFFYHEGRFHDGRYPPKDIMADDDIPIVADMLRMGPVPRSTALAGFCHNPGQYDYPAGSPERREYLERERADGYTLLKGGRVVFTEGHALDWDEPGMVGQYYWYCALGAR